MEEFCGVLYYPPFGIIRPRMIMWNTKKYDFKYTKGIERIGERFYLYFRHPPNQKGLGI